MREALTRHTLIGATAAILFVFTGQLGAQPSEPPRQPEASSRSLVFDLGMLMTTIRPVPAQAARVQEHDLGAVFGFSYRFSRFAQVGLALGLEGNDTSGSNDLLIVPMSMHAGVMTPAYRAGRSFAVSADAALGLEYVVAHRSNSGFGGCVGSGCYTEHLDLSSGPFAEVGMRGYFGRGDEIRLGMGIHYRVFKSSSDFAGRVTVTFAVELQR
jgi:hypothetical protein